jgi:signal transduction histidine kinase
MPGFRFLWPGVWILWLCNFAIGQNAEPDSLERALSRSKGAKRIEILNELALSNWRINPEKFDKFNLQLYNESKAQKSYKGEVLYWLNNCRKFYLLGKSDSMSYYSKKAIAISTKLSDKTLLSDGLKFLGIAYRIVGQLDSSIHFLKMSYNLKIELNDEVETSKLAYNIGNLYHLKSDYEASLKFLIKGAVIDEKMKNFSGYAWDCNLIGGCYLDLNNLTKAKEYLEKAQQILIQIGDKTGLAENYNFFGNYYVKSEEYSKAEENYRRSYALYTETQNGRGIAGVNNNLGMIYEKLGKYDLALKHSLESLNYKRENNDLMGVGGTLGNIGTYYQKIGNLSKAIEYKLESAKISKEGGFKDWEKNAYLSLSEIYAELKDYKNAFLYHQKFFEIYNEIYSQDLNEKIAEMQAKFDVEQKKRENELLRLNNELQNVQINEQIRISNTKNIIFASFSMVFIIVMVGAFVYYNRYKENQRLRAEIMVKEAENLERKRISQDLHDHVGAQLTYVISNLDWIVDPPKKFENTDQKMVLKSIRDASKQAILTLRETVWALNHNEIAVDELSDKFKQFTSKMMEFHENLTVKFHENIESNHILAPNDALNIFRICQESFTNSLRHSGASEIEIQIQSNSTYRFYFCIRDNGTGFDLAEAKAKGHYGLENMKERAQNIGLEFHLETSRNSGTRIEFYLKKLDA